MNSIINSRAGVAKLDKGIRVISNGGSRVNCMTWVSIKCIMHHHGFNASWALMMHHYHSWRIFNPRGASYKHRAQNVHWWCIMDAYDNQWCNSEDIEASIVHSPTFCCLAFNIAMIQTQPRIPEDRFWNNWCLQELFVLWRLVNKADFNWDFANNKFLQRLGQSMGNLCLITFQTSGYQTHNFHW